MSGLQIQHMLREQAAAGGTRKEAEGGEGGRSGRVLGSRGGDLHG